MYQSQRLAKVLLSLCIYCLTQAICLSRQEPFANNQCFAKCFLHLLQTLALFLEKISLVKPSKFNTFYNLGIPSKLSLFYSVKNYLPFFWMMFMFEFLIRFLSKLCCTILSLLKIMIIFNNTGCPVNWYSLSISIPDFPDGPMKKS